MSRFINTELKSDSDLHLEDDDDELINYFCGMVDRRKTFSLISARTIVRSSPSRISDTPRAGFEPAQNLCSGLVE